MQAPSAAASALAGRRSVTLPNGLEVLCHTVAEARFFFDDIFEKRTYVQHGIRLEDVDCVFDVGANIGLFTLFIARHCPHATIYAFEPAPPSFALLEENTRRHAPGARLFRHGLAAAPGEAELTFYPASSGMSSFRADLDEEKAALLAVFESQRRKGEAGMAEILAHADDLVAERFRAERFVCRLETLSNVLRRERVERIDLLKIDVQKVELEVLGGLAPEDWSKVRQVVVEVHDKDGALAEVERLLTRHGFAVTAAQDDFYEQSILYNVYAVRRAGVAAGTARSSAGPAGSSAGKLSAARQRAERQRAALGRTGGTA